MQGLGFLPGDTDQSQATDVSADGSVVVGTAWHSDTLEAEAFRWTPETGIVGLAYLPGGQSFSNALAVSDDGMVVVGGGSVSSFGSAPYRWTPTTGMVSLGHLPGGVAGSGVALDTSADGSLIVGRTGSGEFPHSGAFVWDERHGMRSLYDVLTYGFGIELDGWHLDEAVAISADGRMIAGNGRNPAGNGEAWIVTIPEPSSLLLFCAGLACLAPRWWQSQRPPNTVS
jgi:probable HAF family extracellular repeat protein